MSNMRIHKITTQHLAENMKEFVDYFLERGSVATLAAIDNCYQVSIQLKIVVANADEIDWAEIGVRDVAMFLSGARTIISDIENASQQREQSTRNSPPQQQIFPARPGYVYLIRAVHPDNYYKIGLSKEPKKRISTLNVALPFPIDVLHLIKTDDMYGLERLLHERYAAKRVNGEWFALSDSDVAEIVAMKGIE